MTEEDTFKLLSRASIPEMLGHYDAWIRKCPHGLGKFSDLEGLCIENGWTWQELSIEGTKWRAQRDERR